MSTRNRGFTLTEILVATVVLGLVLILLHEAHVQQRRVSIWQQRVATAHDGYRVTNSIISAELREAVVPDGDVALPANDSMVVRSPEGFGIVCATRANPAAIGLAQTSGSFAAASGDSLLVYTEGGWRTVPVVALETPGQRRMRCAYGPRRPEVQLRLPSGTADSVPVGAPVRAFSQRSYHEIVRPDGPWLARTDAAGTEALLGPLHRRGIRFRLLDDAGAVTRRADRASGVELRLILAERGVPARRAQPPDTLLMVFQGRNR